MNTLKLLILCVAIGCCSCSVFYQCPEGSRAIKIGDYKRTMTPDSIFWCFVRIKDLENYCRRYHLYYVGTYHEYHLVEWADIVAPIINGEWVKKSEGHFAISDSEHVTDSVFSYSNKHVGRILFPRTK